MIYIYISRDQVSTRMSRRSAGKRQNLSDDMEDVSRFKAPYALGGLYLLIVISINLNAGLRIRNDLFRIRIRIFYFWIADPDQTMVKGWRVIIMLVKRHHQQRRQNCA